MNDFFSFRKILIVVFLDNKKTVKFGTETIEYIRSQIWNLIAEKIRNVSSFYTSKMKLKTGMLTCVHVKFVKHAFSV